MNKAIGGVAGGMLMVDGSAEAVECLLGCGGLFFEVGILSLELMDAMNDGEVVGVVFVSDVACAMWNVPFVGFIGRRWEFSRRGVGRCVGWQVPFVVEFHGEGGEEFV